MNVYVSNIPTRLSNHDLISLIVDYGDVIDVRIITGTDTKTNDAVVELADDADATGAMKTLSAQGFVCKLV